MAGNRKGKNRGRSGAGASARGIQATPAPVPSPPPVTTTTTISAAGGNLTLSTVEVHAKELAHAAVAAAATNGNGTALPPRARNLSLTQAAGPTLSIDPQRKEFHSDAVNLQVQSAAAEVDEMVTTDMSRVLIIYTGGTIGMQNTREHGYVPVPNYLTHVLGSMTRFHDPHGILSADAAPVPPAVLRNMQSKIVRAEGHTDTLDALITPVSLWGKRIIYSVLEYDPLLDSSNMTMKDWVKIASDIELNYEHYDAFIILHGTDTMAYTASALSFMLENLGKTVIITGSQVPLAEVRNDAIENLLGALTIAGHFVIPEVTLYFSNKLYRGNRTSKVDAVDFAAFDSPNLAPLVTVGINIDVHWRDVWRPRELARFRAHKTLDPNVATLRIFPGITLSTIRAFLQPPIRGVVLETYGAGNGPDARADLLAALREAHDRGVVLINCTQCKKGLVSDVYSTGKALVQAGVVPGADMTAECALTKLSYLLGKGLEPDVIRKLMRRSLRGELAVVEKRPRFALSQRDFAVVLHHVLGRPPTGVDRPPAPTTADAILQDVGAGAPTLHIGDAAAAEGNGDDADLVQALHSTSRARIERTLAPLLVSLAAAQGNTDHVAYLLRETAGAPDAAAGITDPLPAVNAGDPLTGATPLHHAAAHARLATVRYLLGEGATVHARDRAGHTPLWAAVTGTAGPTYGGSGAALEPASADPAAGGDAGDRLAVIDVLVQTGAHFGRTGDETVRAGVEAGWASARGDAAAVTRWIRAGVAVSATFGPDKKSMLHAAAEHLNDDLVEILLRDHGADAGQVDAWGLTAAECVRARSKAAKAHVAKDKAERAARVLALLEAAARSSN
ncbi:hypothetical protein H9P43_005946 [Blastocladiella emersonii ATCC 22665]|nr:hypothetical protein H9P43_005946 [Blastocladiella emersonii ATCC 22665]